MEKLRPNNANGDAVALAALALGITVLVTWLRLEESWPALVNFIYTALAAGVVLALAYLSPAGSGRAKGYQNVLYVTGLGLTLIALLNLKDVFGDFGIAEAGTRVWMLVILVALTGYVSWFRNSGVMTLFCALLKIGLILSFVEWLFSPDEALETYRWLLAIIVFAFVAVVLFLDVIPAKYRQVAVVDAAGFALIALSFTFLSDFGLSLGSGGASAGWEIIIGLGSLLLIAYALIDRDAGPAYLGGFNLVFFSVIAAAAEPSVVWWPLILFLITIAAFAAVLTDQRVPSLAELAAFKVTASRPTPAVKTAAAAKSSSSTKKAPTKKKEATNTARATKSPSSTGESAAAT
jgi:hypothetical protein